MWDLCRDAWGCVAALLGIAWNFVRRSRLCSSMEPAAVAALAVAIDHVHAETLNSLVLQLDQLVHENQESSDVPPI